MGNIVGIDLGTTNSAAAFKLASVEVVSASDNTAPERKLTRSVVSSTPNGLVVGEEAYRQLKAEPENVIISIKRLMGRSFSDSILQQQLQNLSYRVTQSSQGTENSLSVWLREKEYEPEDISAEILKKVVQNAQNYQQQRGQTGKISEAVITIPAYFNDKQRHATQAAAKRANLMLAELLPEPTAAAISYGFKPDSEEVKTILVYDFGGGTFDSSIITSSGNQFIESGKAGDLWLGGDDIDELIINFVKQQVAQAEDLDNIDSLINKMPHYQRVRFLGDLKMAVEQAKIALSSISETKIIPATPLLDELGMTVSIDVTITREQFEEMIFPLVERTINICHDAIKYSEYPPDLIDMILLVGGSSQIPLVQRKIKEVFGTDKVVVHPRPMYAVAEGAAIVAAGLTEKVSTVSRDYFIELADNSLFPLIKQGDILPVKALHSFKTQAEGQSLIHLKFLSPDTVSESLDNVKRNERIGEMWLALDKPYPEGTEILVTVELDEKNNALAITAILKNDPSIRVSSTFSRGGIDEEIYRQVEEKIQELNQPGKLTQIGVERACKIAGEVVRSANQIKKEDGGNRQDRIDAAKERLQELEMLASDDINNAQYYVYIFDLTVEHCRFLIPESQVIEIEKLNKNLKEAIAKKNIAELQKLCEDAKREAQNLPPMVQCILAASEAIFRAQNINPHDAQQMSVKLNKLIEALKRNNSLESQSIWNQLSPDVSQYLNRPIPTTNITTGLTR
ncbi:MAG: Hsp70 family protein [Crocosphaera sp.]|nr:Hsp70 family protein [Crocosphaera sp.]